MKKLPILYNENFRCHGNVCYVSRINPFFSKLHRIGPSNMCVNFEKNRLNIDDFRSQIPFFINSTISHWLTYKIVQIFKWPWPLTFIWPWPWVWPLTLTVWRNTLFSFFFIFFEVTWRKNVTSYVKTDGRIQKCHSIKNFLQPTRNLYHFRFKSYGPLCDFHWFFWSHVTYKDDVVRQNRGCLVVAEFYKERFPTNQKFLRLPVQKLWAIMWFLQKWWPWPWSLSDFHQKKLPGSLELSTSAVKISERLNQWCGLYIVQLRTGRQTDKWKGTLRVHTLQNWTYRLSDLPCRLTVTKVKDTINWS